MHKWMWDEESAQSAKGQPKDCELQDCQSRICWTERCTEKGSKAESTVRSRSGGNTFLEDDLDKHFKNDFEDEA